MLSNKTAVYEKIVDSFTEYMNEILCINHHFVSEKSEQNAEVRAFEKPCNDALRSSVSGESVFVSMGSSSTQPQKKKTETSSFGFGLFKKSPEDFRRKLKSLIPVITSLQTSDVVFTTSIGYMVRRGNAPFGVYHVPNDVGVIQSLLIDNPTANKKNPEGNEGQNQNIRQNWVNFWIYLQTTFPEHNFFIKSRLVPSAEKIQNKWCLDEEMMLELGQMDCEIPKYFCDWGGGQIIVYQRSAEGEWKEHQKTKISANELFSDENYEKYILGDYTPLMEFCNVIAAFVKEHVERDPEFIHTCFIQTGKMREHFFKQQESQQESPAE